MFGIMKVRFRVSSKLVITTLLLLALVVLSRDALLAPIGTPERLQETLMALRVQPLAWAGVMGLYLLCSICFFPLLMLVAATSAVFGPWAGFCMAVVGALAGASLGYALARRLRQGTLHTRVEPSMEKLRYYVQKGGVTGVALLRTLPLSPFTVTNFGLGLSGLRFGPYLLGTLIGLLPGITVFSFMGGSLIALLEKPDATYLFYAVAGVVTWGLLLFAAHRLMRRTTNAP